MGRFVFAFGRGKNRAVHPSLLWEKLRVGRPFRVNAVPTQSLRPNTLGKTPAFTTAIKKSMV
jgi:hypothetical protein